MYVSTCTCRDATSIGPMPSSSSASSRGHCTAPEHALAFAPGVPRKVTVRFPPSSACSHASRESRMTAAAQPGQAALRFKGKHLQRLQRHVCIVTHDSRGPAWAGCMAGKGQAPAAPRKPCSYPAKYRPQAPRRRPGTWPRRLRAPQPATHVLVKAPPLLTIRLS